MINVILPVLEDVQGFCTFIDRVSADDVRFFVGIREDFAQDFKVKSKNVVLRKFNKKCSREEIINGLDSGNFQRGQVLVARRALSYEEFYALVNSNADIAVLRETEHGFKVRFKNFIRKTVKKIFGFSYFEDISACIFKEQHFDLVVNCPNLSMATRIDKYVGMKIEEVPTSLVPVKKHYSRLRNGFWFMFWTGMFEASIVATIILALQGPLKPLVWVCLVCWMLSTGFTWVLEVFSFSRTIAVGNVYYGRAEEVDWQNVK